MGKKQPYGSRPIENQIAMNSPSTCHQNREEISYFSEFSQGGKARLVKG